MKTNTILKTITYSELAPFLYDINTLSDGYDVDYWLEKIGKDMVKLPNLVKNLFVLSLIIKKLLLY